MPPQHRQRGVIRIRRLRHHRRCPFDCRLLQQDSDQRGSDPAVPLASRNPSAGLENVGLRSTSQPGGADDFAPADNGKVHLSMWARKTAQSLAVKGPKSLASSLRPAGHIGDGRHYLFRIGICNCHFLKPIDQLVV